MSAERSTSGEGVRGAMVLMTVAMLMLPGIDAIAKWLSATLSPGQITWSHFGFQVLFTLPFVLRIRAPVARGDHLLHALRGTLLALTTLLIFVAVRVLPLADTIAIFFVEPLILTLLGAVLLGEQVGWRRVGAVLIGFAGALLVIRPSYSAFGWAALLPLGGAVTFAFYLLITRRLAQRDDPTRMQFLAGLYGCLLMTLVLVAGAVARVPDLEATWPGATQWLLLALLGAIATCGHLLVVHAFRRAPASLLAPFQYLEIVGATVLGLLFFDDFPDAMTWLGIAIIVGSGLYVFHRERSQAG